MACIKCPVCGCSTVKDLLALSGQHYNISGLIFTLWLKANVYVCLDHIDKFIISTEEINNYTNRVLEVQNILNRSNCSPIESIKNLDILKPYIEIQL